ncbi:MAG: carboxypeptidase regulatory-like domain-containing protein, partial [Bacteroidota bacterium]
MPSILNFAHKRSRWSLFVLTIAIHLRLFAQQPYFDTRDVPSQIYLGEYAIVTVQVRNTGSSVSDDGGISISFPTFTRSNDHQFVIPLSSNSGDSPGYIVRAAGSTISNRSCSPTTASYLLVEYADGNWQVQESNYLQVRVRPQSAGTFPINIRSAMHRANPCDYVNNPSSSSYTDQQGWPVWRHNITVLTSTLSGRVTNSRTSWGIENATVSIIGPTNQSTLTNSNGDFSFSNLSSGIYTITVTKTGYPNYSSSVSVSGSTTRNVSMTPYITINSFSVSPTTTYPGGRLTITYSLSNSSGSSQIVWLGASVKPNGTSNYLNDPSNDVSVSAPANTSNYSTSRYFDTQSGYTVGSYDAAVGIWRTKQGGLMVDNYDRKELTNAFTLVWSTLSGRVTNSRTSWGIENATVSIIGPTNQSTLTNSNGDFSFSN